MYKILNKSDIMGFIENPIFIRKLSNGNYTPTTENLATGVVIDNVVYSINGYNLDDKESVTLIKMDSGSKLYNLELTQDNTDALIVDQEYRLTLLELGVTE